MVVSAAITLVVADSASAASVRVVGDTVRFRAATGEVNDVVGRMVGNGVARRLEIQERNAPLSARSGCAVDALDVTRARCDAAATSLDVTGRDLDDTIVMEDVTLPTVVASGPGNDAVAGGLANDVLKGGDGDDQLKGDA